MNHNDLLQNDIFYQECGELINENIITIENEISTLREYFANLRKNIARKLGTEGNQNANVAREFYDRVLKELAKIEQVCEEYRLGMKIDLAREAEDRLELPSRPSLLQIKETCERCRDIFANLDLPDTNCRCFWRPIPNWYLEDARDIIVKPKPEAPTAFDESDLKFKQEINMLRTKVFSLPKNEVRLYKDSAKQESTKNGVIDRSSLSKKSSADIFWNNIKFNPSTISTELEKINVLKFLDGVFTENNLWSRILDMHGNQLHSKWQLIVQPQIETLIKKRRISQLHLDVHKTYDLLSSIPENGIQFTVHREVLIPLIKDETELLWLRSWKLQFRSIEGPNLAATLIQAHWRGYSLRKKIWETERQYVAASVIWYSWLRVKQAREMHKKYLSKMLESIQSVQEESLKLSRNFTNILEVPHVVIHLVSLGYPSEIRRIFNKDLFSLYQNGTSLRISFARNPKTHVIYILPVKPTSDLLTMYSDIVESVSPEEDEIAKRITFVGLSEAEAFKNRALNLSRILHCSQASLTEIKKKVGEKPVYILPWIVDECDIRLAANLRIPLLSPSMDLQQRMLNPSRLSEIIESLDLLQPSHTRDIRDYDTLCSSLAELIIRNTEIASWLIRLNCGSKSKHSGVFLINHISVPFMPTLRRDREEYENEWGSDLSLWREYLKELKRQLPKVVSRVTMLPSCYSSWKEFYIHILKFGCLVQAVPFERNSSNVVVSLFLPGKESGKKAQWTGTANKVYLEKFKFSMYAFMIPQTSVDTTKLAPVIDRFVNAVQEEGYFGYLSIICYCYPRKHDEKLMTLILDVHPYYSHLQSYIDWMNFAIGGHYKSVTNVFTADVVSHSENRRRATSFFLLLKTQKWDETSNRYAIAIPKLQSSVLSSCSWSKLKELLEQNEIKYDPVKKLGSHLLLQDSELRSLALMISINSSMSETISMSLENLKNLHRALHGKSKSRAETNIPKIIDFFTELSLNYVDATADPCV